MQGRNVLRAWEDRPEAARYALMLRAEDLPLGKPTELPMTVSATIVKHYQNFRGTVFCFGGEKKPLAIFRLFFFAFVHKGRS